MRGWSGARQERGRVRVCHSNVLPKRTSSLHARPGQRGSRAPATRVLMPSDTYPAAAKRANGETGTAHRRCATVRVPISAAPQAGITTNKAVAGESSTRPARDMTEKFARLRMCRSQDLRLNDQLFKAHAHASGDSLMGGMPVAVIPPSS